MPPAQRVSPPTTFREVVVKFATLSTIRGLRRVPTSQNMVWSIIWLVAILASMCVIVQQITGLINSYKAYEFTQTTKEEFDNRINYPSITICNLQPFNSDYAQPKVSKQYLNGEWHILEYLDQLKKRSFSADMLELDAEGLASMVGYFQNIEPKNAQKFGHSKDNFILDCKIEVVHEVAKSVKTCSNVSHFISPQYFNCYTVTVDPNEETKVSKISLILYLDDFGTLQYPRDLIRDYRSQMHGAKIVIHEDGTWPDIIGGGDEIGPGVAATFLLTEVIYNRLGPPYEDCESGVKDIYTDHHGHNYTYTRVFCEQYCKQGLIMGSCKCKLALLPIPDESDHTLPYCDDIRKTSKDDLHEFLKCAQGIEKDFGKDDVKKCGCEKPCHQTRYEYIKALSQWPHDAFHLAFYETFIENKSFAHHFNIYKSINELQKTNSTKAYEQLVATDVIERNFVKVEFQMQQTQKTINSTKRVDEGGLMSSVGGALSLWLGISTIVVIEILEFFSDLFSLMFRKNRVQTLHVRPAASPEHTETFEYSKSATSFSQPIRNGNIGSVSERYPKLTKIWI